MSLTTPGKIRELQIKLYRKAKNEPEFRFYQLYDKVYREDILTHAYELARANHGAPGVDGKSFEEIESAGLKDWMEGLREELRNKTYQPQPVRRVLIPKPGGGERPLGIPTIRDRVVQTAAKLILEPIWEAELEPNAYGYRPQKSAQGAIQKVDELLHEGYTDVVDADLSKYFDTIPHSELLQCVARRIVDRQMLHLIKAWLKVPVEERDETNRMLKGWRRTRRGEQFRAQIVNYADDFVILSRGKAKEALEWTHEVLERLELTLNEKKTCIRNACEEHFDFLGYTFGPHYSMRTGREYIGYSPSKKSLGKIKENVGKLLVPSNVKPWAEVSERLNQKLQGWRAYFSCGSTAKAYRAVDEHVYDAVRHFLRRRHKVTSQGTHQFPEERVFGTLGVIRLQGPMGARSFVSLR